MVKLSARCVRVQAHYAEVNSNWTDGVFRGTADLPAAEQFPHLLEEGLASAERVTLDQFRHLAALVSLPVTCALFTPLCDCAAELPMYRPWLHA